VSCQEIAFHSTERIVDNTIALIRQIEKRVHDSEERLFWLVDREEHGPFLDSAFG